MEQQPRQFSSRGPFAARSSSSSCSSGSRSSSSCSGSTNRRGSGCRNLRPVSAYRLLAQDLYEDSHCSSDDEGAIAAEMPPENGAANLREEEEEEEISADAAESDLNKSDFFEGQGQKDWNQQLYLSACTNLKLTPSQKFLQSLLSCNVELRRQHLGSAGAFACAAALKDNANIRSVALEANELGCRGAVHLTSVVTDNPYLCELRLIDNCIGEMGLLTLTNAIITSSTVKILDLSGNRFEEKCGAILRKLLEQNTSVEELLIAHNNFREQGIIDIASGLARNSTLQILDLSWNHIRLQGAICLCDCLRVNKRLRCVQLGWNGLYLQGCKSLAKSLPSNTTLERLDLSCNRIDMKCLEQLLKGLRANKNLKSLCISQNPLTAENIRVVLNKIEELRISIEELDVTGLTVDPQTVAIAQRISSSRQFSLIFGVMLKQEAKAEEGDTFLNDDPMMVLMEFMKLKNMRLLDLFMSLDADGSKSLSHGEFKQGLLTVGVPMSVQCIQRLIRVLDIDGDGEIDYSELIAGQREHRRRMMRIQIQERNVPYDETELGMINLKLRRLLAKREKAMRESKAAAAIAAAAPASISRKNSSAIQQPPPPPKFLQVTMQALDIKIDQKC